MSTPLPEPSILDSHHHSLPHPSRASIILIVASLFSFGFFVFLSVHKRPSRRALAISSPSITNKPSAKHKPKLWEVRLDEDHRELTRLDGAVRNWQPLTAWTDYRLGRLPRSRQASAPRALPEPAMHHRVAVAQAWFHDAYPLNPRRPIPRPPASPSIPDHRTLSVGVLVAMPSRRLPSQPMHGIAPHSPIGSRLSYSEGQLSIGITSVSCVSGHPLPEHELGQTT
ncbi:hypothetical protein EDB92DRAFT_1943828 [Lactarius akahatsu]|uniref:Uncharacterized protein n=1 Tax=Lactarius akahatsu TaxID=416441 RepID=A0AAD4LPJ5_9AGAM|nr:hypothetical protein EDB92DRAFT_1943828 [Lactarius akahatsu]